MKRFIIISLCTFAFFASHEVKSEDSSLDSDSVLIEAPRCEDSSRVKDVQFTRPGVIEKMKPFVIQETKNIKKSLIQAKPS